MPIIDQGSRGGAPQIAGTIGYEVLARYTTTFDFPRRTVSLSLTQAQAAIGSAPASPMTLDHTVPAVEGEMGGVIDYFWLDTGFDGAILVNRTFGIAHPAAVPKRLYDIGSTLSAVGADVAIRIARIPAITVGSTTFANTIGMFSNADGGLNTDSEFAADVGDALLRSYAVTFDYRGRRFWLMRHDASNSPYVLARLRLI
jgi:hypothetical protein